MLDGSRTACQSIVHHAVQCEPWDWINNHVRVSEQDKCSTQITGQWVCCCCYFFLHWYISCFFLDALEDCEGCEEVLCPTLFGVSCPFSGLVAKACPADEFCGNSSWLRCFGGYEGVILDPFCLWRLQAIGCKFRHESSLEFATDRTVINPEMKRCNQLDASQSGIPRLQ